MWELQPGKLEPARAAIQSLWPSLPACSLVGMHGHHHLAAEILNSRHLATACQIAHCFALAKWRTNTPRGGPKANPDRTGSVLSLDGVHGSVHGVKGLGLAGQAMVAGPPLLRADCAVQRILRLIEPITQTYPSQRARRT